MIFKEKKYDELSLNILYLDNIYYNFIKIIHF